jgi:TIR domain/SIR2-like domain
MESTEEFWDDLLSHLRQRVLIPIVGSDLTVVDAADPQPLTRLVAQRLVDRYSLRTAGDHPTTGDAVAAFLREYGREEVERLYRVINNIIDDLDPEPGAPLRDLAAISDFTTFVSTTPDRLLTRAINDARFGGAPVTRELAFSPSLSTTEIAENEQPAVPGETVVLRLFGKVTSTPQYAIHEEDRLEWMHALLTGNASLPEWLAHLLRHNPLLFIGYEIPDWLGRFLLRVSSKTRLALGDKQFFVVTSAPTHEPRLADFLATYCRRSQVQQTAMTPGAFVAELRERWSKSQRGQRRAGPDAPRTGLTIFISYLHEDAPAARALRDAIAAIGGDVWMDERRLAPGDDWAREILASIRKEIRLFVAVLSANTERREEGYVFREWEEAADRSRAIPRRRFIVPVVVDADYDGNAARYRQVPPEFTRVHYGVAPHGVPGQELIDVLTSEIRAMRRVGAE